MRFYLLLSSITFLFFTPSFAEADAIKVHRVVAGSEAWNVNSYIIESVEGLIIIDTQLLKSDAKKLADLVDGLGKPLAGVILTHPHMDHFGGVGVLRDRFGKFPIYADVVTAASMEHNQQTMRSYYGLPERLGDNLESRSISATEILEDGQELALAGVMFDIRDAGPGEAEGAVLIYQRDLDILFAGDVFFPQMHYYVGDGRPSKVLNQLELIKRNYSNVVHILSGHSNPARPHLVDAQIDYVKYVLSVTESAMTVAANLEESGHLTEEARATVVAQILEKYRYYEDFGNPVDELLTAIVLGAELETLQASK